MINAFKPYAPILFNQPETILTPESLNRDINPKPLHSHNDYWRIGDDGASGAFIEAVKNAVVSIESDVWVFDKTYTLTRVATQPTTTLVKDKVYVGHNHIYLKNNETLNSLYLDPLFELLEFANPTMDPYMESEKYGIYYNSPESATYFWMDFKMDAEYSYKVITPLFEKFIEKNYLAYYDYKQDKFIEAPIIVTITGNLPNTESEKQYFFIDAPLHKFKSMDEAQLIAYSKKSKVASSSMEQLLGNNEFKKRNFTDEEKGLLKQYFDMAHQYGIKTRIWGGTDWPFDLVKSQNSDLLALGCDLLNTDDLSL